MSVIRQIKIGNTVYDILDTIRGTSNPTTSTVGEIGQMYYNTATGATFKCTAISGSTYTWIGPLMLDCTYSVISTW